MLKLGGKCEVKIEVTKNIEVVTANGDANGEEKSAKKKKRKHSLSLVNLEKALEVSRKLERISFRW